MGLHDEAAGSKISVRCPACKTNQDVYHRSFYGVGKKCIKCKFVFEPLDLRSSNCDNYNHQDCVMRKPKSKKKCHCWCLDQSSKYENVFEDKELMIHAK